MRPGGTPRRARPRPRGCSSSTTSSTCYEPMPSRPGSCIVLEDLHWADSASFALLRHVTAELHDSRILIVASYRDSSGVLAELIRAPGVAIVRLSPFTADEVVEYLVDAARGATRNGRVSCISGPRAIRCTCGCWGVSRCPAAPTTSTLLLPRGPLSVSRHCAASWRLRWTRSARIAHACSARRVPSARSSSSPSWRARVTGRRARSRSRWTGPCPPACSATRNDPGCAGSRTASVRDAVYGDLDDTCVMAPADRHRARTEERRNTRACGRPRSRGSGRERQPTASRRSAGRGRERRPELRPPTSPTRRPSSSPSWPCQPPRRRAGEGPAGNEPR